MPGRRAGYAAEAAREPLAARFYDDTYAIPGNLHAVERNRRHAAAALGYEPNLPLVYGIAAEPLAAAWVPAAPYCVLLTASSRADKLWPEASWRELIARFARADFALQPSICQLEGQVMGDSPPSQSSGGSVGISGPQPLPGVHLTFENTQTNATADAYTDSNGHYGQAGDKQENDSDKLFFRFNNLFLENKCG